MPREVSPGEGSMSVSTVGNPNGRTRPASDVGLAAISTAALGVERPFTPSRRLGRILAPNVAKSRTKSRSS
jgi:hypothetical protein